MLTLLDAARRTATREKIRGYDALAYDRVSSSPCLPGRNNALVVPVDREKVLVEKHDTNLAAIWARVPLKDTVERPVDPDTNLIGHTGAKYQCPRCFDPRCLNRALSPCHNAIQWIGGIKRFVWRANL